MSLIADGLLIATCLTCAIYCYVLSKRLRSLNNTDEGIGSQIKQLNTALEETKTAVKEIKAAARTQSERLAKEVSLAKRTAAELSRLITNAKKTNEAPEDLKKSLTEELLQGHFSQVQPEDENDAERPLQDELSQDVAPADAPSPKSAFELIASGTEDIGDQQLGFLPDADDEGTGEVPLADETAKLGALPSSVEKENLLKVERMAL